MSKWVFPKIGVPQNGWFIMENHIKMDDLGVPLFSETSKCLLFSGISRIRRWCCRQIFLPKLKEFSKDNTTNALCKNSFFAANHLELDPWDVNFGTLQQMFGNKSWILPSQKNIKWHSQVYWAKIKSWNFFGNGSPNSWCSHYHRKAPELEWGPSGKIVTCFLMEGEH